MMWSVVIVVSLGMLMTEVMPIPQNVFEGEVSAIPDGQSGDGPPGKRDVNEGIGLVAMDSLESLVRGAHGCWPPSRMCMANTIIELQV
ncbi:uncharacterized protein LOC124365279 isoform X2 [Homalodisca vitripennis]|nr:uncharacterized protein LOC124365279 isoform X2 [Homalodisca vitripennis]